MSRGLSVDLVLYAFMLVGLSIVAQRFSPHGVATILPVGLAGGLLAALLGLFGLLGRLQRRRAIVAITVLSLVLLAQAFGTWLAIWQGGAPVKPASLIPTLLWLSSVGQLLNLIQSRSDPPTGSRTGDRGSTDHNQ
jgi:hypothetical protein